MNVKILYAIFDSLRIEIGLSRIEMYPVNDQKIQLKIDQCTKVEAGFVRWALQGLNAKVVEEECAFLPGHAFFVNIELIA